MTPKQPPMAGAGPPVATPAPSVIPVQWPPKKRASAALAVLSVVFGAIGLLLGGLGSALFATASNASGYDGLFFWFVGMLAYFASTVFFLPGLTCGIIALSRRHRGRVAAITGIVICMVHLLLALFTFVVPML